MGWEDLSLGQVIRGVFGVLFTVIIVFIIGNFTAPLYASEADKGTRTTLGQVTGLLEQFDGEEASMPRLSTLPDFYIEDTFVLVAFDADANAVNDACSKTPLLRPFECAPGRACICLCMEGKGCRGQYPSCHSFGRIKRIGVEGKPQDNFLGASKLTGNNDLLVFGDCGVGYAALKPMTLFFSAVKGQDRTVVIGKEQPVTVTLVNLSQPQAAS